MQLLNLFCQDRVLTNYAVDQLIGAEILLADLADIDTLFRCRTDGNELTANVVTGSQKLMAFERCYDEDLGTFPTHAESYQLERKVLPAPLVPRRTILAFLYTRLLKISTMTKLLLCWLTPSRMPFSSLISNEVKG